MEKYFHIVTHVIGWDDFVPLDFSVDCLGSSVLSLDRDIATFGFLLFIFGLVKCKS